MYITVDLFFPDRLQLGENLKFSCLLPHVVYSGELCHTLSEIHDPTPILYKQSQYI